MSTRDVDGLLEAIRAWRAGRPGRAVPSPSSTARCTRQLWYIAHGQEPDNFPDNGESTISAESGSASEGFITEAVRAWGWVPLYAQDDPMRELDENELRAINCRGGQVDNLLAGPDAEVVLLEIKRKGTIDMKALIFRGLSGMPDGQVLADAFPDEYTQMQLLMRGLRAGRAPELTRGLYIAANWDRGGWTREVFLFGKPSKQLVELGVYERPPGLWVEWVPFNEVVAEQAARRAERIGGYIDHETNPGAVPKDPTQPGDFAWTKFPCTWCAYLNACRKAG